MKISTIMRTNAFVNIALGIAFGLYAPLMISAFGIADLPSEDVLLYWYVTSFARLFGAAIFASGLFQFTISRYAVEEKYRGDIQRTAILTALIANIILAITALTQQFSIWQSLAGWVLSIYFILTTLVYVYFWVVESRLPGREA